MSFIKNDIIELRALEPDDVDLIFTWENERSKFDAAALPAPVSRFQVWQYIQEYNADPFSSGQLRFMVADTTTGQSVGHMDLYDFDPVNLHASIGVFIGKQFRRNGYAQNALKLMCEYCRNMLNMHQLLAHIAIDNAPSQTLFEGAGFMQCGQLRSWMRRGNSYTDVLIYQNILSD